MPAQLQKGGGGDAYDQHCAITFMQALSIYHTWVLRTTLGTPSMPPAKSLEQTYMHHLPMAQIQSDVKLTIRRQTQSSN
jgi:hypothetical protein